MAQVKPAVRPRQVILFAGALIAFLIGSGFATGQEVLQYFTSYGYWGVFGAGLIVLALIAFVSTQFMSVGHAEQFSRPSLMYRYFCGRYLGAFFDYFSILFIFMSFMVMVSGAGAVFEQHYQLPNYVGGVALTVAAAVTVSFGLSNLVVVIGKIGPVIVIIALALGIWAILSNPAGVPEGQALLPELEMTKASTNWFLAALSYVGFVMLWLAAFLTAVGKKAASRREAWLGGVVGAIGFSVAVIVVALGLLANIARVAGTEIPMLYLANDIGPWLATGFSVVIIAGIYSTAVPLLWTVSSRFLADRTRGFRLLTLVLAAAGCLLGLLVPFSQMVNIVYVINGYVGILLLAFMVFAAARQKISRPRPETRPDDRRDASSVARGQDGA